MTAPSLTCILFHDRSISELSNRMRLNALAVSQSRAGYPVAQLDRASINSNPVMAAQLALQQVKTQWVCILPNAWLLLPQGLNRLQPWLRDPYQVVYGRAMEALPSGRTSPLPGRTGLVVWRTDNVTPAQLAGVDPPAATWQIADVLEGVVIAQTPVTRT